MSGRYQSPKGTHNQKNYKTNPTPHQIRRQRARALAKHLTTLTKRFPEFGHLIQDPLFLLEQQSRRAQVLHAVHVGAWTIREIQTETKLPDVEIQRLLKSLIEANIIFTSVRKEKNKEGGRPTTLYLPSPNSHP